MAKDFKKFTAYDELHGTVLTTTRLYEFTDTEMQEHDERIRKEERERVKKVLIEYVIDLDALYKKDINLFFAQLDKEAI